MHSREFCYKRADLWIRTDVLGSGMFGYELEEKVARSVLLGLHIAIKFGMVELCATYVV
jgi:hypothetical protein